MGQTRDQAGARPEDQPRPLRADARDNRQRLLEAARDAFIDHGPGASLEEIARRAGTGIATLYRRFPDRQTLMREVVLDAIEGTIEAARRAAAEEPDPFRALARYMHEVIDMRTAAVISALLGAVPLDGGEMERAREVGPTLVQGLVDAAQQAAALRQDVTSADIGLLIVRLSRPLAGGFARETNASLSHRHLELVLDGLRPPAQRATPLPGPALTFAYLRQLPRAGGATRPGNAEPT
jgi:AcrR family transcriptional regulator